MRALALAVPLAFVLTVGCTYRCKPVLSADESWLRAIDHLARFTNGEVRQEPVDYGAQWGFTAIVGPEEEIDPNPILIDKQTGFPSWASESKYRAPTATIH
jgi:hypothetical protein